MKQPEPTKDVIEQAAELLMGTNGKTSSLDVKNYLRNKNYWAKQRVVSEVLQELANEKQWKVNFTGTFNEYTIKQATNVVRDAVISEIENHSVNSINGDGDRLREDLGLDESEILAIMDTLEADLKIDFNIQKINPAMPSADISKILTVSDLVNEANTIAAATHKSVAPAQAVAAPPVTKPVVKAAAKTGNRSSRAVINDSKTPSTSSRVSINIDPKYDKVLPLASDPTSPNFHGIDDTSWVLYPKFTGRIDMSSVRIYDGKYKRDHVRTAYARLMGLKIQETRSCRVSNF